MCRRPLTSDVLRKIRSHGPVVQNKTAMRLVEAWTCSVPPTMNEREPVFEYACHEGNQAIRNILSAARAAERGSK